MNRYHPHYMAPPPWHPAAQQGHYPVYPNSHPYGTPPYAPSMPAAGAAPVTPASSMMGSSFVKGALIGAAAAYLLSNEQVQQSAIKTAVKSWAMLQGGIEEMKERFLDAEAELHASQMDSQD